MKKPAPLFYSSRILGRLLLQLILNVKIEGLQNIPKNKQYILICNHVNWTDPFLILGFFPPSPRIVFLSDYDAIYDSNFKKKFVDLHGKPLVFIDRWHKGSRVVALKSMYQVVRNQDILAMFPEGRIEHQDGELFPFYVGVFSVAKKLNVPILPMVITGNHILSFRKPVHVRIGQLTHCKTDESGEDYAKRIAKMMHQLMPSYPGDGPFPNCCNWLTHLFQGELRPFKGKKTLIIPTRREKRK